MEQVTIAARFRGPERSANGGYACGVLARRIDAPAAEVTLRAPPPLDVALDVGDRGDGTLELRDRDLLVAEGAPLARLPLELPDPVAPEEALAARAHSPLQEGSPYPECFVCGPARGRGDGLGVTCGPVEGRELVAAPWEVDDGVPSADGEVTVEMMWSALDCPSGIATMLFERRPSPSLLGRLAARVLRPARVGETLVAAGWPIERDGRKSLSGTALFDGSGRVIAYARATWIEARA